MKTNFLAYRHGKLYMYLPKSFLLAPQNFISQNFCNLNFLKIFSKELQGFMLSDTTFFESFISSEHSSYFLESLGQYPLQSMILK